MKFINLILIALLLSVSGCGRKYGIERYDRPGETPSISTSKEGEALIRSLYCDISIRQIKDHHWEKILENEPFKNSRVRGSTFRVPKLLFFMVTIKNTWNYPVLLEKATINHGEKSEKKLTSIEISSQFKSPLYKIFNFEEILRPRRLLSEVKKIDKFNFADETIPYRIKFIPPGDSSLEIIAFEKPPARVREYMLNFHLKLLNRKK